MKSKNKGFIFLATFSILFLGCSESVSPLAGMGKSDASLLGSSSSSNDAQSSGNSSSLEASPNSSVTQMSSSLVPASSSSFYHCAWCPPDGLPPHRTIWDLTVPIYEVQTPSVMDGSCGDPTTCAGWWYGYGQNGGDWSPKNSDGTLMTIDPMTGDILPNGSLTSTGLRISLKAPAASVDSPSIAGIGFDYNLPAGPSNITANLGYFITYTSDTPLQMELGWDTVANGTETWQVTLPAQAVSASRSFSWYAFKKQEAAIGAIDKPITEATDHAWSLHIFLKNTSDTAKVANFELQSLGL